VCADQALGRFEGFEHEPLREQERPKRRRQLGIAGQEMDSAGADPASAIV
jgi:hypothetical protein